MCWRYKRPVKGWGGVGSVGGGVGGGGVSRLSFKILGPVHTQTHLVLETLTDIVRCLTGKYVRTHESAAVADGLVLKSRRELKLVGAAEVLVNKVCDDASSLGWVELRRAPGNRAPGTHAVLTVLCCSDGAPLESCTSH